jgi:hypothetical protein
LRKSEKRSENGRVEPNGYDPPHPTTETLNHKIYNIYSILSFHMLTVIWQLLDGYDQPYPKSETLNHKIYKIYPILSFYTLIVA